MFQFVFELAKQTLRSPRLAAPRVFELDFDRRALWLTLALVSVVSVLANEFTLLFVPEEFVAQDSPVPQSASTLAVVIWGLLALTVFATHYIGRAFKGVGSFDGSLKTVIWMQVVMLFLQVLQIACFIFVPVAGLIFGFVGGIYMLFVFLIFVQELHGFKSLGGVALGAFLGFLGMATALGAVMVIVAKLFGLEISANV